ncbi:MAG TPA: aldo/keto reductase [Vicinamibacterales bacterium]|nr:aldo/keto reductase [Vicinamibacterales bacterium]
MTDQTFTRREFVKVGAAGAAAIALGGSLPLESAAMSTRPLGRTGHQVRLFSLGGQATIERAGTHDESLAIINRAIDLGVNYIDTAAAYGRGISQGYIGEVMKTRRKEVFLASKTHDRTRDGSLKLLEQSLQLLQTDRLDLWQLHNISRDEQLDTIFGKDGAIEALQKARDEKMVRFLGITGHFDPDVLIRGIQRFDFDTILMALNPADRHHLAFTEKLLPLANEKKMGVIGMKIPARGRLFRADGVNSMKDAMSYVLTLPVSTVIVGCDTVKQLEENVSIAGNFRPLPATEMARLEKLTAGYVSEASWFKRGGTGFTRPGDDDQNTD